LPASAASLRGAAHARKQSSVAASRVFHRCQIRRIEFMFAPALLIGPATLRGLGKFIIQLSILIGIHRAANP
jgi:hypothetical protein